MVPESMKEDEINWPASCFAGKQDELIVASSNNDCNLYVWSLPGIGHQDRCDCNVQEPLVFPSGHTSVIQFMLYNHENNILASVCGNSIVKLWTVESNGFLKR